MAPQLTGCWACSLTMAWHMNGFEMKIAGFRQHGFEAFAVIQTPYGWHQRDITDQQTIRMGRQSLHDRRKPWAAVSHRASGHSDIQEIVLGLPPQNEQSDHT